VNALTGVGPGGRAALLLAQYLPALFFAAPARLPAVLEPLYSPAGVKELHNLAVELDIFFEAMFHPGQTPDDIARGQRAAAARAVATRGAPGPGPAPVGSTREYGTYREFEALCARAGLTPHVLSPTVVQQACEHVLGVTLRDREHAAELLFCKNDWVEVLFVLAQLAFDHGDVATGPAAAAAGSGAESKTGELLPRAPPPRGAIQGEPVRKLADLLRCFRSLAYLPHVVGRLRKGGDLDSALLWLRESDRPTLVASIGRGLGPGGRYIPPPVAASSYSAHFSTARAQAQAPFQGPGEALAALAAAGTPSLPTPPPSTPKPTPTPTPSGASQALALLPTPGAPCVGVGVALTAPSAAARYGVMHRRKARTLLDRAPVPVPGAADALALLPTASASTVADEDDDAAGLSFREVAILLAHFPHRNTLALNPWTVYQLAVDALREPDVTPGARKTPRHTTEPEGDTDLSPLLPYVHERESLHDPRSRLAKVVRAFSARFHVSTAELADHLARFHKDADTGAGYRGKETHGDRPTPLRLTDVADAGGGGRQVRAAVQSTLSSPVFDLLLSDRAADALRLNAGLLYWEFSRCVASLRSSDPFSRDRKAPLPTEAHLRARPLDCRVTASRCLLRASEPHPLRYRFFSSLPPPSSPGLVQRPGVGGRHRRHLPRRGLAAAQAHAAAHRRRPVRRPGQPPGLRALRRLRAALLHRARAAARAPGRRPLRGGACEAATS